VTPWKLRNCENPLRVESKIADDAQSFNIRAPIFFERLKLETSNLVCAATAGDNYFDGMQKLTVVSLVRQWSQFRCLESRQ